MQITTHHKTMPQATYTLTLKRSGMDGLNSIAYKVTPPTKYVRARIATKKVTQGFWSGKGRDRHTLSSGDKTIPVLTKESQTTMTIVINKERRSGMHQVVG